MKIKTRAEDHKMVLLMIFAVHHKVFAQQGSRYRHILPSESRISVQARNVLGPLFLKDILKLRFQPEGQMMFSPPSRKHLQVVLEKLVLSWKNADDALPSPILLKEW